MPIANQLQTNYNTFMFDIFKILDLSYLGKEWENCYLKFHSFSIKELLQLNMVTPTTSQDVATEKIINILKSKFVEGFAIKNGERIAVVKDDLDIMPLIEVINPAIEMFKDTDIKKNLNPSPNILVTPSEV